MGGADIPARVVTAVSNQIQAILPPRTPTGSATLTVARGGTESRPFALRIGEAAPGLYTMDESGSGPGRFTRLVSGKRVSVGVNSPAKGGDRLTVSATGLGPPTATVKIVAGSLPATGVRMVRQQAAPDEIEFNLPRDVPQGCFVPVYAVTAGGLVSNIVTLAVDAKRSTCHQQEGWLAPSPGRTGAILVARINTLLEFQPGDSQPGLEERVSAYFYDAGRGVATGPLQMMPPPGTCTAFAGQYEPGRLSDMILRLGGGRNTRGLNVGNAIHIAQGPGGREIREFGNGVYDGSLVSRRERTARVPVSFLLPGFLTVSARGGTDIGPFQVSVRATPPLIWTNLDQSAVIKRREGAIVDWKDADATQPVLVAAVSVDRESTAAYGVFCAAAAGQSRFRVPPEILANLPATLAAAGPPLSLMFVLQSPTGASERFSARGLDYGHAVFLTGSARSVLFQ